MYKKINLQLFLFFGIILLSFYSCKNDYDNLFQTSTITLQLNYPDGFESAENVRVSLINTNNNTTYLDSTNADGLVTFQVPNGVYQVSVSEVRTISQTTYIFTGSKSLSLNESFKDSDITTLDLSVSESNAIIIKELYNGGCQKDDGSGAFYWGQYIILFNNSGVSVTLDNLCLAYTYPYNSNSTNYFYENGTLSYEAENWAPAAQGIWYFPDGISVASGEQIVVALNCAIDNTVTYSQAINFANADYYTTYDIDVYSHTTYYPSPSSLIPTSHYLLAIKYGAASAWSLSASSPAFFLFNTKELAPIEFANNVENIGYFNGDVKQSYTKVPNEWIVDAVEVYKQGSENLKRLPSAIDAGYVTLTSKYGYTLYRNVNMEATEALPENAGKIVYGYTGGTTDITEGSTDPSGIDAEASIANGARIIYSDTNNSTIDYHQRAKASLRH